MSAPTTAGAWARWQAGNSQPARTTERLAAGLEHGHLASLQTIGAAVLRKAWLWGATATAGLAVGIGLFKVAPPAYQASTSILVVNNPVDDPGSQMLGNIGLAHDPAVAAGAMRKLGIQESVSKFLSSYTVSELTDQVLQITAMTRSSGSAVREADVVAAEFLHFRATLLHAGQRTGVLLLREQILTATQHVSTIAAQTAIVSAEHAGPARSVKLRALKGAETKASATVGGLQYALNSYPVTTLSMIKGTAVLDSAVPVPPSRKHLLLINLVAGLVAGLSLGLGFTAIQAVTSGRVRRRDEVARTLGIPVAFSTHRRRATGRLLRWAGVPAVRRSEQRRIVTHLRNGLPAVGQPAALAVVPVDDVRLAALTVASLAMSCAWYGRRVVLADLSRGFTAARLLGISEPGVHHAGPPDARLTVAVPEQDDLTPVGPLRTSSSRPRGAPGGEALAARVAEADVLLSIATLEPALGADFLATWATDVVVMVTAGKSTGPRIHAVGEMVRLAGTRTASAVLVGADNGDESLGVAVARASRLRPARV